MPSVLDRSKMWLPKLENGDSEEKSNEPNRWMDWFMIMPHLYLSGINYLVNRILPHHINTIAVLGRRPSKGSSSTMTKHIDWVSLGDYRSSRCCYHCCRFCRTCSITHSRTCQTASWKSDWRSQRSAFGWYGTSCCANAPLTGLMSEQLIDIQNKVEVFTPYFLLGENQEESTDQIWQ